MRLLGEKSSGPRTLGYDANPNGLKGTPSIADYKKSKKQKEKDKKGQVQQGKPPPYEPDDGYMHSDLTYFTTTDMPGGDPNGDLVVIGEGDKDTAGEGWTLSLKLAEYKKVAVLTARAASALHILDVSDKGQIKLPTAPLENGMVKHDHKVIMPKTLKISGIVKREQAEFINSLIEAAEISPSLGTFFTLVSPWKIYKKMYLKDHTSKANNKKYDVYDYTLDLSELLIARDLKDSTDDGELASNVDKGAQSGK